MSTFRTGHSGFTLIELMIVVVAVAILSAIALPAYNQYIVKANRRAAQAEMVEIAVRQQQSLLVNRQYADKATLVANGYALPSTLAERYSFDVTAVVNPPSFLITFDPISPGPQAGDGSLTLNNLAVRTPADKW